MTALRGLPSLALLLAACSCLPTSKTLPDDRATIDRVASAAVTVRVSGLGVSPAGEPSVWRAFGSATVVKRASGRILALTCRHVVRPDDRDPLTIEVGTLRGGGLYVAAAVVVVDPDHDLALIEAAALPDTDALRVAIQEPLDHERLYVVASPNNDPGTVADAILSNHLTYKGHHLYQITSFVWPGSSGGTLASAAGELVGVPRSVELDDNDHDVRVPQIGYAVALQDVRHFLRGKL